MAFCMRCGRELRDGELYCPDCGTPAGMVPKPVRPASKRGGFLTILLVLAVAFLTLSFFLYTPFISADYEIRITVEEFAVAHTDQTVDNDPMDNDAEIMFQFEYNGVTKYIGNPTNHIPAPVGDPDVENWHMKEEWLTKLSKGNSVSFNANGSGSVYISFFMFDYDGKSDSFGTEIYDTIDVYNAGVNVDRPGVSGIYLSVDLTPGVTVETLIGDDLPMGYVKLSIAVKKL